MEIPYTVEPRKDTGLYNGKMGVWLFLASEVMLFGGLFSAYVLLRVASPAWPVGSDILNVPLAMLNTFVLITSSVTMVMAWASLKMNNFDGFKKNMKYTFLLACGFCVIKSIEYGMKFSHGVYPSDSTFLGIYFTLTGLHALHVIGGMVVMFYLWFPGAKMWKTNPEQFTNRIEVTGLYWHFVDLVWIFLFPVLYLL